jgi:hypothetical protein
MIEVVNPGLEDTVKVPSVMILLFSEQLLDIQWKAINPVYANDALLGIEARLPKVFVLFVLADEDSSHFLGIDHSIPFIHASSPTRHEVADAVTD